MKRVRRRSALARVLAVDSAAARLDGVVAVWTLADLPELAAASVPPLVPEGGAGPIAIRCSPVTWCGMSVRRSRLADYGVEVDRIPVTSARIFEMLRSARPD